MIVGPNQDVENAWGVVYQVDAPPDTPKAYFTSGTKAYLVQDNGKLRIEMVSRRPLKQLNSRPSRKERKARLVKISRNEFTDNVKVRAMSTDGKVIKPSGIGDGTCFIYLPPLDMNIAMEMFCDEQQHPQLCELDPTQYRIISCLGRGSYGTVYRALSVSSSEFCALKIEKRGLREKLPLEYKLLSKLRHESIITATRLFSGAENNFLQLTIAEGGSLQHRLRRGQPVIDDDAARYIFRQVFAGVAYIHQHDIVHRDLKCENIVLTSPTDRLCGAKIIDFGISCYVDDKIEMARVAGSPSFMAPEVIRNYGQAVRVRPGKNLDVWSLGVCVYATLLKQLPFVSSKSEYFHQDLYESHKRFEASSEQHLRALKPEARDFISSCLVVEMLQRPQAEEMMQRQWLQLSSTSLTNNLDSLLASDIGTLYRSTVKLRSKGHL